MHGYLLVGVSGLEGRRRGEEGTEESRGTPAYT